MPPTARRRPQLAPVLAAALLLGTCGGGDGPAPTGPVVPAPAPTPIAAPTPGPAFSASCERLPLGSEKYACRDVPASFQTAVMDAYAKIREERPEYFSGLSILNIPGFYAGMIRLLDKEGLCAEFDGEELAVKETNEFSEQYRLHTSWGEMRRSYMGACFPATFPIQRKTPGGVPAGCTLAPSVDVACGDPSPEFLGDVNDAIATVVQQKPELFDFSQTAGGGEWPMLKDFQGYHAAVIAALAAKGYCGVFGGEEITIKRSNEFSENYDINYADKYVRRGPGIYRGACYPAAF